MRITLKAGIALSAFPIVFMLVACCVNGCRTRDKALPIADVHEYEWSSVRTGLCISVPYEATASENRVYIEVHPDFDSQWIVSKCRCMEDGVPFALHEQNPDSDELLHGEYPAMLRQISIRNDGHSLSADLYCLEAGKKYNLYFLLYPRRRGVDVGSGKRQALSDFWARGRQ